MSMQPPASLTVIDYGVGNVGSVLNMARKIGATVELSNDPDTLRSAQRLVLSGVGAFDHGVQQLKARGLFDLVRERALGGTPLLGICLGMQLLAGSSEEGVEQGLALVDGESRRFVFPAGSACRIPHVGWNEPAVLRPNPLLPEGGPQPRFYFTHSYHLVCRNEADVVATAEYGYAFPAVICHNRVYGVQFHPEKSHRFGMALLKNFAELPV